jgi:hypothetical protein
MALLLQHGLKGGHICSEAVHDLLEQFIIQGLVGDGLVQTSP